jgi:quercetin dioxygenase-like cupin family protein
MIRTLLVLAAGLAIGLGGVTRADHDGKGDPKLAVLSAADIAEKIDGKEARVTTVELTMEPGQSSPPHRHAGPVFGYVIEGEYEWAIGDQPPRVLKAGKTFYEPTGCLHRVSRNPAEKGTTRVLAVVLHPRDAAQIAAPEPKKEWRRPGASPPEPRPAGSKGMRPREGGAFSGFATRAKRALRRGSRSAATAGNTGPSPAARLLP